MHAHSLSAEAGHARGKASLHWEESNLQGEKAFYTGGRARIWLHAAGETIPASDSEDEEGHGEGLLEGAQREREEWVLEQAARELGTGAMVVEALARRLGASHSARPLCI